MFILKIVFFGSLLYYVLKNISIFIIDSIFYANPINSNNNMPYYYLLVDLYPLIVTIIMIFFFKFKVGDLSRTLEKYFLLDICFTGIGGTGAGILLFSYIVNPILHSMHNSLTLITLASFPDIINTFISLLFESVSYGLDFSFLIFFAYFIIFQNKIIVQNENTNNFKIIFVYIAIIILSFINALSLQAILFSSTSPENTNFYSLILYPFTLMITRFALPALIFYLLFKKFNFNIGKRTGRKLLIIFSLIFIGSSIPFILLFLFLVNNQISYNPNYLFTIYFVSALQFIIILFTVFISFIYLFNSNLFFQNKSQFSKTMNNITYKPLLSKLKKEKKYRNVIHEPDVYLEKIETILDENKG